MNVPTVTMPVDEARRAFDDYRKACRGNPTPADKACMLGYQALASGRAVLDLPVALRAGGLDDKNRPRLAVARAHWLWVRLEYVGATARPYAYTKLPANRRGRNPSVVIPRGTFETGTLNTGTLNGGWWRAMVPAIPPKLRPANPEGYFVLWEAEWQEVPPRDPMLLRHLVGNLYAVLAVWDLTELERLVLREVRNAAAP